MATTRRGLAADPLATRLPPLIPTAEQAEQTTGPDTPQPVDEQPVPPGRTGRGAATEPAAAAGKPARVRREGSIARIGPMSYEPGAEKKSYSFYIDPDLLEEARDTAAAVANNPAGPPTISALFEEGVRREIVRLQDELNGGKEFPPRAVRLRPGGNKRS